MNTKDRVDLPFIKLDQFLKWQQIAATGGQAKLLIQNGLVEVNGEMELRRGRKLYPGDTVTIDDLIFEVQLADESV
ncbi:MAG: RNA-binding S4 domain-containing protein [Cyanobacteria bacterium J06638_28]